MFLQRFGDSPGDSGAGLRVLEPLLVSPPSDGYGLVRTADGDADVYGLGTDSLMFTHASCRQVWQVMVDVAHAAGYAIMPVGCPTCRLVSVALVLAFRRTGVTRYPASWSSDFPRVNSRLSPMGHATVRPSRWPPDFTLAGLRRLVPFRTFVRIAR